MQAKRDQFTNQVAEKKKTFRQNFQAKNSEFETQSNQLVTKSVQQNQRFELLQSCQLSRKLSSKIPVPKRLNSKTWPTIFLVLKIDFT